MNYTPKFTNKEIQENHKHFIERIELYKKRGIDNTKSREIILKKVGSLSGEILELGTGSGYTTVALAKTGYKLTAIDKDKDALRITALNLAYENLLLKTKLMVMDAGLLRFKNNSFNTVIVIDLFHHISDTDKVISEMNRVLKAKGKMLIADFDKKAMEIINAVHKEEGNTHENIGAGPEYIYSYLQAKGYALKHYEDSSHWILVGEKK